MRLVVWVHPEQLYEERWFVSAPDRSLQQAKLLKKRRELDEEVASSNFLTGPYQGSFRRAEAAMKI
jgi:hypothetical protein